MVQFDRLKNGAQSLGLALTDGQLSQFEKYHQLIQEWNQRVNLTAVQDAEMIQERHFLDSLACVKATGELNGCKMIDVGTGAGFPGIPLKICFPNLQLTLLESIQKKIRFLGMVVSELKLTKVSLYAGRAEEFGHLTDHREVYDWAVARAVAPLRILSEYLLPLTQIQGYALAQKGSSAPQEVAEAERAVHLLGGGDVEMIPVYPRAQDKPSYLVKIQKIKPTPGQYPRRIGVPTKRPL